jgi:hypothetical protein
MNSARMRLKYAAGWFAAGREVAEAMALLSDGAFKLFIWLCLHADRRVGALAADAKAIARALGKTDAEITRNLGDLFQVEICRRMPDGRIQITDRFWPYERAMPALAAQDAGSYAAKVREFMLARLCVRSVFSAADHKLALQLYDRGITLQVVERAIHLGCLRKYAALLNNHSGTAITSLHYFNLLFTEVAALKISDEYWSYVGFKLRKLEQMWSRSQSSLDTNLTEELETK